MDITKRTLRRYGLNEKEIDIYLVVLRKQEDMSPYLLAKETGIPRTTVYDVLLGLSLKGLIELDQSDGIKKQQTRVRARNPSVLRRILQKKRKNLLSMEADIISILPHLQEDYQGDSTNTDFQFYPGIEGFRRILGDSTLLDMDIPLYTWSPLFSSDVAGGELIKEDVTNLIKSRKTRKNPVRQLIVLGDWAKHVLSYQYGVNHDYLEAKEIRYVENPMFDISTRIELAGNVVRMACAQGNESWGLVINSKALASSLTSIFMMQWITAKPLTKEMVEGWGPNEMVDHWGEVKKDK